MRPVVLMVLMLRELASAAPHVAWHAPAGCPDANALLAAIAQRIEVPLEEVELAATVEVEATAQGFVAHVDAGETRELAGANCAELTTAVAVIVARQATVRTRVATALRSMPLEVAPPPPAWASAVRWHAGVRVSGLAGTGDVPDVSIAGELAAFVTWNSVALELAGLTWRGSTIGMNGAVDVGAAAIAVHLGWQPDRGPRAWGVLELDEVTGTGTAIPGGATARSLFTGVGAGYAVPLALHVTAVAAGEALLAIDQVAFETTSGATVYRTPALALRARLGLELAWP
ncbi:hypothetical protein BH11MYX1_BH11MYX1_13200 [soil metagenome]